MLEVIKRSNGVRLTDVSNKMDIPKSTAHRYLQTLMENEYLILDDKEYKISGKFINFAHQVYKRSDIYEMIEDKIEHLANETDELVQFIIEEHNKLVYVFQEVGGQGIQINTETGNFGQLHSTSGGKAILSTWSDNEIDTLLDVHGLPKITQSTITDREEFFNEINVVREKGYAINNEENIEGVRAISTPVCRPDEKAIGAISISGPIHRMKGTTFNTHLPDLLLGVSNEIELNFRFLSE